MPGMMTAVLPSPQDQLGHRQKDRNRNQQRGAKSPSPDRRTGPAYTPSRSALVVRPSRTRRTRSRSGASVESLDAETVLSPASTGGHAVVTGRSTPRARGLHQADPRSLQARRAPGHADTSRGGRRAKGARPFGHSQAVSRHASGCPWACPRCEALESRLARTLGPEISKVR